ncbi:MAG: hypothetical protein EPN17_00890 [Methylobacter sp.]|nr:MAG: hypothetical protein EPN17_00890 [Methylobacter sp.]
MKKIIILAGILLPILAIASDGSAIKQLKGNAWVKDLYVSPGHMNVGVISKEKNWDSPMIARYVCGVLKKNSSDLNFVRFVDIEQVLYKNKTPNDAEIAKFTCRDVL